MFNNILLGNSSYNHPLYGVKGPVVNYHGFKLQRHISDKATVITYKAADGKTKRMAALDAKYRNIKTWISNYDYHPSGVPMLSPYGKSGDGIVDDEKIKSTMPMPDKVTNEAIYNQWSKCLCAENTAKWTCDQWIKYKNSLTKSINLDAISWCRGQDLAGHPCDVPNLYELFCIRGCGDKLDEMDITSSKYPQYKLGYTAVHSDHNTGRSMDWISEDHTWCPILYSSLRDSIYNMCTVSYECDWNVHAIYTNIVWGGGLVPIIELD